MISNIQKLLRPAQSIPEKMIKVNHAGENGAVNIYRGQQVFGWLYGRKQFQTLQEFEAHEREHRTIFANYLGENKIRRCISYHFCGIGGLTLGIITGLLGKQIIAATTFAVETVVLEHLDKQLKFLKGQDIIAFECVKKIYDDEKSHRDQSAANLNMNGLINGIVISIVSFFTEYTIKFGMR
jgi:ubiquinone biosynthesis monooxygenase Coq7